MAPKQFGATATTRREPDMKQKQGGFRNMRLVNKKSGITKKGYSKVKIKRLPPGEAALGARDLQRWSLQRYGR